jgi:hypothetical protein
MGDKSELSVTFIDPYRIIEYTTTPNLSLSLRVMMMCVSPHPSTPHTYSDNYVGTHSTSHPHHRMIRNISTEGCVNVYTGGLCTHPIVANFPPPLPNPSTPHTYSDNYVGTHSTSHPIIASPPSSHLIIARSETDP